MRLVVRGLAVALVCIGVGGAALVSTLFSTSPSPLAVVWIATMAAGMLALTFPLAVLLWRDASG